MPEKAGRSGEPLRLEWLDLGIMFKAEGKALFEEL
jgi:hypothetical protein